MKKKNKTVEVGSNNFGENVLIDQKYDGFAPFVLDGRDQSRYSYFRTGFWVNVQADEYAIVMDRFNPSRSKVEILGPGLYPCDPRKKFIYVPNPYGPTIIDFKPKEGDSQDRKDNFTFTPGLGKGDNSVSQDEIYIDYKVKVRLYDLKIYFFSSRVIQNLKATIVSVIREFVADKDKDELFSNFSNFGLEQIDKHNKLRSFREDYGLEVLSLDINNIKLSDEVQKAKNEAAAAKEKIKQAEHEKEAARIRAEGETQAYRTIFDFAKQERLNNEAAISLISFYTSKDIAKNPGTRVFLSNANLSGQVDPRMMFALYGGDRFYDNGEQAIDGEETIDPNARKKRK